MVEAVYAAKPPYGPDTTMYMASSVGFTTVPTSVSPTEQHRYEVEVIKINAWLKINVAAR